MTVAIDSYVSGWLDLVFRWFHVIAAIVWIGTSFYFVALDQHLHEPREEADLKRGVGGESWEIHGGGFYRIEKFRVAPPQLPKPLHWYKWEAYWTWLTGFTLFVVLYYLQAHSTLIDPSVAQLSTWEAVVISIAGLALAWIVYDVLCRTVGQRSEVALAFCVLGLVALAAYGASRLFAPQAAYLQVGAMLGTIMAANVFFVIIPAHRELVEAKEAGREPDPAANRRGKQRSVHNNYLTLPVLFSMLAVHNFPFTYGHSHSWAVLVCLMVIGAWIRYYFNNRHAGRTYWWIPLTAAAGIAAVAVWIRPASTPPAAGSAPVSFTLVRAIVAQRCAPCHSMHPTLVTAAPRGVVLDTAAQIQAQAARIKAVAVDTRFMPLGNVTHMTVEERTLLAAWIDAGAKTP